VTKPRTVIDLLAEQSEAELRQMRDATKDELQRAQAEVSRLSVEAQLIDAALAKLRRSKQSAVRGNVTGETVLAAVERIEPPFSPADVRDKLAANGLETSLNNVRNHLNRLVERGALEKAEDGGYYVRARGPDMDFTPAGSDEDIPF
jgi:DNA-binding transcriptional ArsR family regulator